MQKNFSSEQTIKKISSFLKKAQRILFITGAGISADSGLPTYRGIGGLYENGQTEEGISIEDVLSGDMFETDPLVTWKYLSQIEENCRGAEYNRAHKIIAELENYSKEVWIFTQNIDGFHCDAGSTNVIEIHGNIHQLICMKCLQKKIIRDFSEIKMPPLCQRCKSILRPDVVLFGETLPSDKFQLYMNQLETGFDLYFWVGTMSVFPYVQMPVYDVPSKGGRSVEINPSETEISSFVDMRLPLKATEALEEVFQEFIV